MSSSLDSLEKLAAEGLDDKDRRKLVQPIAETRELERRQEFFRLEQEDEHARLKRQGLLLIAVLFAATVGCVWYLVSVFTNGYITYRGREIFQSTEPLVFWLHMAWPIAGLLFLPASIFYVVRSVLSGGPNPRFEGTAAKHSLPVPRPLRGRAAPQAKR